MSVDPLVDDTSSRRDRPRRRRSSARALLLASRAGRWRRLLAAAGRLSRRRRSRRADRRRRASSPGRPGRSASRSPPGLLSARLSVKTRDGGEGRSPLAEFQAAPPPSRCFAKRTRRASCFPAAITASRAMDSRRQSCSRTSCWRPRAPAAASRSMSSATMKPMRKRSPTAARPRSAMSSPKTEFPQPSSPSAPAAPVLPIAPNATAPGRRANNRVVLSALAAEKPLPEIEPMPASVRARRCAPHSRRHALLRLADCAARDPAARLAPPLGRRRHREARASVCRGSRRAQHRPFDQRGAGRHLGPQWRCRQRWSPRHPIPPRARAARMRFLLRRRAHRR